MALVGEPASPSSLSYKLLKKSWRRGGGTGKEVSGPWGPGLPGQGVGALLSAEHPLDSHEHTHQHLVQPHPCGGPPPPSTGLAQRQQLSVQRLRTVGAARVPAAASTPGACLVPSLELRVPLAPLEGMALREEPVSCQGVSAVGNFQSRWLGLPGILPTTPNCRHVRD